MSNPLQELDGQRRYIFSANATGEKEKMFLRVVASPEEIMKCEKAVALYTNIISEARSDLEKELQAAGKSLKNSAVKMTDAEKAARVARSIADAPSKFGKEDNLTYFIVESEAGDPILTLSLAINNPAITRGLGIESPNHLLFQGVIIHEKYRGQSIAAAAFDEVFLTICDRIKQRPLDVIAPVSSTEIVEKDGSVKEFLIHGDLYLGMLRAMCGDSVFLQPRVRTGWKGDYEKAHGDRIPGSECDPKKIGETMKKLREENMGPGRDVGVGAFVIGSFAREKTIEVLREEARSRMDKREKGGKVIRESNVSLDWVAVPPSTSIAKAGIALSDDVQMTK